jgi:uncharacterized membrane protein
MPHLGDHLSAHWLAIVALLAAAAAWALRRPTLATTLALPALSGLLFTGVELGSPDIGSISVGTLLLAAGIIAFAGLAAALAFTRRWSRRAALITGGAILVALGSLFEKLLGTTIAEQTRTLRGIQFVKPWWLVLLALVPWVVLTARRSLSGLGPVRKWSAIALRSVMIAALATALAEPRFGRPTDDVTVLYVIDRSLSVPVDVDPSVKAIDQVDKRWTRIRDFVEKSAKSKPAFRNDMAGVILFGKRPRLALPPSAATGWKLEDGMAGPIDGHYTDIAAALKLAMASFPEGAGRRIVLVSDGNENLGNAEEQAALAKQNGTPIDTIALAPGFRNENEVLVQSVEAPRVTTAGTKLPVRVLVRNASPSRVVVGLLELVRVGPDENGVERTEALPVDADNPDVITPGDGKKPSTVRLKPGLNAFRFRDKTAGPKDSSYSYRSTFTPVESANDDGSARVKGGLPGDRVANNRAGTVVITRSQRKVLFIDGSSKDRFPHAHLINTLRRVGVEVTLRPVDLLDANPEDFLKFVSDHDCIVLADVPAESLSFDRQEAIRTCVHDQGCGLIMIGGPDAFGPGGYQGTPVEAALPVDCEIKALKAAGRGGLILIMHASEMAEGNKWQKDVAKLAINRLTPNDMVGVMQYGFGGGQGVSWVIPFSEIGDRKNRMLAAVDGMTPGDMPDFDPFLVTAVDTLIKPEYNLAVKHTIIISDGDPQYGPIGQKAVKKMADNNVTCTTVGVATHSGAESGKLKSIAAGTKDGKGQPGSYYEPKAANELPGIYIKESRRISQSFIYDKPFQPQLRLRGGPTDGLPNRLPELKGFVRTTMKESALAEMSIEGPRMYDQQFPILAQWQYGLGKAVAFTSDARTQPGTPLQGWDAPWAASDVYQRFWEQAVQWAMRAAEKGKMTVMSDYKDGRVKLTVEARDEKDRPIGGLDLKGGISLPRAMQPGEKGPVLNFKKKGAGLYEAEFNAEEAGSYFVTIQGMQAGANGNAALFDTARTGVTVPYSQEFADLETNTPLLKRLSELTGGEYHTEAEEDLKKMLAEATPYRVAPKVARAIRPFWFWLVFAAGMLLLADVAIRRVSLEWHEVAAAMERWWQRLRSPTLAAEGAALSRLQQRKLEVAESIEKKNAARRFDPESAPKADPPPAGADAMMQDAGKPPLPPPPPPTIRSSEKPEAPADMFSQLGKAKKRAGFNKPEEPRQ